MSALNRTGSWFKRFLCFVVNDVNCLCVPSGICVSQVEDHFSRLPSERFSVRIFGWETSCSHKGFSWLSKFLCGHKEPSIISGTVAAIRSKTIHQKLVLISVRG
jgi:hypothetical protein